MTSPLLVVFKKELKELSRDKRVRTSALFGPIILILALLFIFGTVIGGLSKPQGQKVHVVETQSPILDALKKARFNVIMVPNVEAGKTLVKSGDARVVLDIKPPNSDGQIVIDGYLDPKQQTGEITTSMVQAIFGEANKQGLSQFLKLRNLPAAAAEPIKFNRREIQVGEKGGAGDMIVGLLPYMIVIWAFYGGMSVATEMVAGEKEKNTLETLMITPVPRTQIVIGKWLALASVCLVSSLSSLVGLVIYAVIHPPGSAQMFKNGMGVTPIAGVLTILLLIPLVGFFASLLMAISSYARNTREAQTYLSLASFVILMPAMFSQFIGLTDFASAQWVNYVPILNTANNIRNALLGKPDIAGIGITIVTSLILAAIATRFTVWLFNREEVLVRV